MLLKTLTSIQSWKLEFITAHGKRPRDVNPYTPTSKPHEGIPDNIQRIRLHSSQILQERSLSSKSRSNADVNPGESWQRIECLYHRIPNDFLESITDGGGLDGFERDIFSRDIKADYGQRGRLRHRTKRINRN